MSETAASGETNRIDRGYRQRIEKLAGSSMYLRIDTGPDLEEAWLCVDDGEPDTHHVAKFISISYADEFAQFWNAKSPTLPT